MSECRIQLRRDTVNTAWGFRLQGGHEFSSPLVVQRVFSGSPADGRLQRGDVFVSINNHDVSRMQQKQAEDIIKAAGSALSLVVKRTGAGQNQDGLLTFANEPQSQPASRGFDNAVEQFPPSAAAHRGLPHGGSSHDDGPRLPPTTQSKKQSTMMWSPGSGGSVYDQPSYRQGDGIGDVSSHKHIPAPRPAPGGQQFSTDFADYGGQDRGPPWQSRDGGGGGTTWNQSQRGPPAALEHRHHPPPQQQPQRDRTQAQRDYGNHGHPTKTSHGISEESRMLVPQVIKSMNQQEEDDTYEQKSVREIKAMFNKPSKPPVPGHQQRSVNRPRTFPDNPAPVISPNTPSWSSSPQDYYPQFPSQTKSFSPPSQPVRDRPSILQQHADLIASYPPPREQPKPPSHITGLIKPASSSAPKPGAGYSYQGLVTVTPPKPVHKVGSGGGSGSASAAGKKKEFDPAQSLVFQMLQEENQRAKSGDVGGTMDEEPSYRRRQPQQQQKQQQQQPAGRRRPQPQQQGSRLQELLERDRAASQQEDEEHLQYADTRPQPPQPHASRPTMNQHRMQPSQPTGSFYHQESTYMKGSPTIPSYHQQPINPSYEYYQQSTPARGYYQNAPHTTSYYSSYGQESVPISDF